MANPQTSPYVIGCVIVGEYTPFSIEIERSKTVDNLKKMIKKEREDMFAKIVAAKLDLYEVEISIDEDLATAVKQKLSQTPAKLHPMKKLANVFKDGPKDETVHIIVQTPKSEKEFKREQRKLPEIVNHVDAVSFFVAKLGIYMVRDLRNPFNNTHLHKGVGLESGPFQTDLPDNHQTPSFVSLYLENLDAKRRVSEAQFEQLQKTFGQATCADHFETSDAAEIPSIELDTYTTGLYLCRLNTIRGKSSAFKDGHVTVLLVDPALTEDDGVAKSWCYDKNVAWEPLLLQGTFADRDSLYTFRPRNDFSLFVATYGPLIMGEIISEETESDRWKMLFEATAVCRYQNMAQKNRRAIILCFYLNNDYKMERYLVYQVAEGHTRDVHVLHDLTLDLTKRRDTLHLSRQLFNFRGHLIQTQIPGMDKKAEKKLVDIQNQVKDIYNTSVTAGAKQAQRSGSGSSQPPVSSLAPISEDAALQASFKAIRVLNHVQKDVATAVRRSDMQSVVLKRIRTNSSELCILRLLQSCALQGSNHIIPLLEVIERPRGISTLVMPYYTSILDLETGQADELALQLIRGVDWLHKQLISHSDIKGRNLVFDERQNCLFIIDFGLAITLTSREQKVRGARGTAEHVAPEVGITSSWENHLREVFLDEDSIYSPMLADIWAVGDVINYFLQVFRSSTESIRTVVGKVAKELQAFDPIKRLSLHDAERRIAAACGTAVTAPSSPSARPPATSPWTQGTHYAVSTIVALQA